MKNLFKFGLGLLSVAMLAGACSDDDESSATDLKLSTDKNRTSIAADGTDAVTFIVVNGGTDVTASAKIYNETDKAYLESAEFTSETEGSYTFVAEYEGVKSNKVTITVGNTASDLTLVPDKTEVTADGTDAITFTVTYKGEDVTAEAEVLNKTDDVQLEYADGVFTFTTSAEGTYEFEASYDGNTSPVVLVTANKVGGGSAFDPAREIYRNVLFHRITSNTCGYCPSAATAIGQAITYLEGHIEEIAVHGTMSSPVDPYETSLTKKICRWAWSNLDGNYYPTVVIDINNSADQTIVGAVAASVYIKQTQKIMDTYPAVAAIKGNSKIENGKVVVELTVGVKEAGEYQLAVSLVEDNLVGYQASGGSNYVHNRTLRDMATEIAGDDLGAMTAGQEITKTFTMDMNDKYVAENLAIVAYVVAPTTVNGEVKHYSNNVVYFPANGSIDYKYAD